MDRIFGGSRRAVTVRTAVHKGPRGLPEEEVPAPLFHVHGPSPDVTPTLGHRVDRGGIRVNALHGTADPDVDATFLTLSPSPRRFAATKEPRFTLRIGAR